MKLEKTQCSCGQLGDHRDQITDYPVGSYVRAVVTLTTGGGLPDVPQGTIGVVHSHCADGRAYIFFNEVSHTFHYPNQCIERLAEVRAMNPREGDRVEHGDARIDVRAVGDGQVWYGVQYQGAKMDGQMSLDDWPRVIQHAISKGAVFHAR